MSTPDPTIPPPAATEPAPGESQAEFDAKQAPAAPAPALAQSAGPLAPSPAPAALAQPPGALAQAPLEPEPMINVTHQEPILTQGASGDAVVRLVQLLAHAGYATNSIVNAQNAHNILDASVMSDVERFWVDNADAREPDELYAGREGDINQLRGRWVGPHTWQKLYDIAAAS